MKMPPVPCQTSFLLMAALAVGRLIFVPIAYAETGGAEVFVSVVAPDASADATAWSAMETVGKKVGELDAAGLLLLVSDPSQPIERAVTALSQGAPRLGARLWIAARFDPARVNALAQSVAGLPVAGVALLFAASDRKSVV